MQNLNIYLHLDEVILIVNNLQIVNKCWLIDYCFMVHWKIFHWYGDTIGAIEGL